MMREADAEERWDDDADDDETKVAVLGGGQAERWSRNERNLRRLPPEKWLRFPIVLNHVTWQHPVRS